MSFIGKTLKTYLFTIMILIALNYSSSIKIKSNSNEKENSKNEYNEKMKKFFELGIDKSKLTGSPKLCWEWLWNSGVESNTGIKATVKQIKDGDIKTFMQKPNTTKIEIEKDCKMLFSSMPATNNLNNESIDCKGALEGILKSEDMNLQTLSNKMKEIFEIAPTAQGAKLFITSAASVHRDLKIRNPDLFKILNNK